jgi:hypothetical protein
MVTISLEESPKGTTEIVVIVPFINSAAPRKTRFNEPLVK